MWNRARVWLLRRTGDWDSLEGFAFLVFPTEGAEAAQRARIYVLEAIRLWRDVAPRSYHRALREMPRIIVRSMPNSWYQVGTGTCMLDMRTALTGSPGWIASTLIHEATHARLEQCGIPYTAKTRARCERLCRRAERQFVELLDPDVYVNKQQWLTTLEHLSTASS